MNHFFLLFKAALINAYGRSAPSGTGEHRKSLGKLLLMVFVAIYLLGILFLYFFSLSSFLVSVNRLDLLLPMSVTIGSLMAVFMSLLHSNGYLYACKDFELLTAMPVSQRSIFLSKFLFLYAECFLFSTAAALPCIACYAIFAQPTIMFYITALLMLLTVPCFGAVLGGLAAFLLSYITVSAGAKNKLLLVFNIIFVLAFMVFSMTMMPTAMTDDFFASIMSTFEAIATLHPLSFLVVGITNGNLLSLLLFTVINLAALTLITFVAGSRFTAIASKIGEQGLKSNFKGETKVRAASPIKALYKRELSAYFSQYVYVLNTGVGFLLFLLAAVALIFSKETVLQYMGALGSETSTTFVPIMCCFLVSLAPSTSSAISMEGSSFWLGRSLPISARELFLSKLFVWFTVSVPLTLISLVIFCIVLELGLAYSIILGLYLLSVVILTGILGLSFDLIKPKLTWTNPQTVVKQNTPVLYSMLVSFLLCGVTFAAMSFLPFNKPISLLLLFLLLAALSVLFGMRLFATGEQKLSRVE